MKHCSSSWKNVGQEISMIDRISGVFCERLEKFKHDLLLQGPGADSTKGVDQLQGENAVSFSSSSAYIETMLRRRSELRTPAKYLAKVAENEGATSECDEGDISEGDEGDICDGDDAAISKGDEGAISEGGDGAISEGVNEMENASQRINGRTQPSKNDLSKVLGVADQSTRENVTELQDGLRALTSRLRLLQFSNAEAGSSSTDGDNHQEPELEPKHKIFLSHSGFQKDFVEQLCVDLERWHYYPFFDKRPESLPEGRKFRELIFQAAQQC